jgi:hypothetical protein
MNKKSHREKLMAFFIWLRGQDLNLRPLGYELLLRFHHFLRLLQQETVNMNNCTNEEDMACNIDGLLVEGVVKQLEKYLLECDGRKERIKPSLSIFGNKALFTQYPQLYGITVVV